MSKLSGETSNLNDFMEYVGLCPQNFYCPRVSIMELDFLEGGANGNNSFQKSICEPGYFCTGGIRTVCPIVNYCPGNGSDHPIPCRNEVSINNQTCFAQQLTEPMDCPAGSVCRVPYLPPLPSPPGYYSPIENRTDFQMCSLVDYCTLVVLTTNPGYVHLTLTVINLTLWYQPCVPAILLIITVHTAQMGLGGINLVQRDTSAPDLQT